MKHLLRSIAIAVAALLLAVSPAQATDGFASGTDLKGWCDHMDVDDLHWGLCVGSITAAHDVVMSYQASGVTKEIVCTTMTHTRSDAVYAVIAYMQENPEDLDYSLGDVVLSALVEKFPCE